MKEDQCAILGLCSKSKDSWKLIQFCKYVCVSVVFLELFHTHLPSLLLCTLCKTYVFTCFLNHLQEEIYSKLVLCTSSLLIISGAYIAA